MMAMTYDSDEYLEFIKARKVQIESLIADAAKRSGRSASEIEVVAVSKTVPIEAVFAAHQAGFNLFGENRPQELTHKLTCLADTPFSSEITFDMIGNLQKNKINQVIGKVRYIHSISSEHLAEAVSKRAVYETAAGISAWFMAATMAFFCMQLRRREVLWSLAK